MSQLNADIIEACADLVGRAGAASFEIGYMHDDVPVDEAGWYAVATYKGAKIMTDEHRSPSTAAIALAERLLNSATCRCGQPVTLNAGTGCRWRLIGNRWEPGCDTPPITIHGGQRGDHAAMQAAFTAQAPNRAARRAAKRRKGSRAADNSGEMP